MISWLYSWQQCCCLWHLLFPLQGMMHRSINLGPDMPNCFLENFQSKDLQRYQPLEYLSITHCHNAVITAITAGFHLLPLRKLPRTESRVIVLSNISLSWNTAWCFDRSRETYILQCSLWDIPGQPSIQPKLPKAEGADEFTIAACGPEVYLSHAYCSLACGF